MPLHLDLHAVGTSTHAPCWVKPLRRIDWHLLVANLDGHEDVLVDGRAYRIGPGDAFLIEAGRPHRIASPTGNRSAWVAFSFGARIGDEPAACADAVGATPPVLAPPAVARLACERVPHLVQRWQTGDALARWEALVALGALIGVWCRRGARPAGQPRRLPPADAIAAAEATLALGLGRASVAAMAAAAGMERSQFSRCFRRLRGVTARSYLRARQLDLAADLLAEGRLAVRDIAVRCGYRDAAAFARAFRRRFGHPPTG